VSIHAEPVKQLRYSTFDEWYTVAVTPLPIGWINVYGPTDGESEGCTEPCPALLLQEHRETVTIDNRSAATTTKRHQAPYETRVVYASNDDGLAHLQPADDATDYLRTTYVGAENVPCDDHPTRRSL